MGKNSIKKLLLWVFMGIITFSFTLDAGEAMGLQKRKRKKIKVIKKKPANRKPKKVLVKPGKKVVVVNRYGRVVQKPPTGYRVLTLKGRKYYYHNGFYYKPHQSGYRIIAGPAGINIKVLPRGYRTIYLNKKPYYYYYGSYYRYDPVLKLYNSIAPPAGVVLDELPQGYEIMHYGGVPYYYSYGTYYRYNPARQIYISVIAPKGLVLNTLPYGYTNVTLNGRKHFYYRGIYYAPYKHRGIIKYRIVK